MLMKCQLDLLVLLSESLILFGEPFIIMIDTSKFLLHDTLTLSDLSAVLLIALPSFFLE